MGERRWVARVGLGIAVAVAVAGTAGLALRSEDSLTASVLVDDALYFAVPARHLVDGHGFSFDKLEPTNGVQVLWAAVTVVLAALIDDRLLLLRAMVALSGACWIAACLLLYRAMAPVARGGALVAAIGALGAGLVGSYAMQGMENGLHALLSSLVLVVGLGAVRRGLDGRRALLLGLLLALFALSRTEGALLGLLLGPPLLLGLLHRDGGRKWRWRETLLLALPGVVLVGGWLVCSRVLFDTWLPISGSVKAHYESLWRGDPAHGPFLANLGWHVEHVRKLAVSGVFKAGGPAWDWLGSAKAVDRLRSFVWLLVAIGSVYLLVRAWRARAQISLRGTPVFALVLAAYCCLHLVLIGTLLPHFTEYGTWYFASEMLAMWGLVGLGLAGAGRSLQELVMARWPVVARAIGTIVATILGSVLLLGTAAAAVTGFSEEGRASRFVAGGRWLESHLPPGKRVGALSAGLVAWYAPSLHVVNLDGLVNTRRYLDEVLVKSRLPDYLAERRIEWFADYARLDAWASGITWSGCVPLERLVPHCYWRQEKDEAYVIFKILAGDERHAILGPDATRSFDRLAELRFAAEVLGKWRLVDEADLAAALADGPEQAVAASIPVPPSLRLRHVLVARDQIPALGLRAGNVRPEITLRQQLPGDLMVHGIDVQPREVRAGARVAVTSYLEMAARGGESDVASLEVALEDTADRRVLCRSSGVACHGTRPVKSWAEGEVVVDTRVLDLPRDCRSERVMLVVRAGPIELRLLEIVVR